VDNSYGTSKGHEVMPLVGLPVERGMWLLELWHGPTYPFKDVAAQFLGNLFEWLLARENAANQGMERDRLTVLGVTSGDSGRSGALSVANVTVYLWFYFFFWWGT